MFSLALLAGGLATRMRPMTQTIPKSLLVVAGRPFIEWQLAYLAQQNVTHVVLCVGYLGHLIKDVVGNGQSFGLQVDYSFDGPQLLGTGGALKKARPLLGETFYVMYGDSYLPIRLSEIEQAFVSQDKPALMTVMHNANLWDKSNVLFKDGALLVFDKSNPTREMAHIDYGLGVMTARVLDRYMDNAVLDLAQVYHALSLTHELAGYEVSERFYEIGSPQGLQETSEYLNRENNHELCTTSH